MDIYCYAVISATDGLSGNLHQFPVVRVQSMTTEQSIDNDADQFSIDVPDLNNVLDPVLARDSEVLVSIFVRDFKGKMRQVFKGIGDTFLRPTDHTISITGRDEPSSILVDRDAAFGKWFNVNPKSFLENRAADLKIDLRCASMDNMDKLVSDSSEKEWALWYRIARNRGMYMWSNEKGTFFIDKLAYSSNPAYHFGQAMPGEAASHWIPVKDVNYYKTTSTRVRHFYVYGEDAKRNYQPIGHGADPHLRHWKKQPVQYMTSTSEKTKAGVQKIADRLVFESIVGSREIQITIRDVAMVVQQNQMALLNIPTHDLYGLWYVVGTQLQVGIDGLQQVVRLREKGYALTTEVPDAPSVPNDPKKNPSVTGSTDDLETCAGIPNGWGAYFARATQEFRGGWDFALFLGVLLAICDKETGFRNERGISSGAFQPGMEWLPLDDYLLEHTDEGKSAAQLELDYKKTFANAQKNPLNPRYPNSETAVGPMQLVTPDYKVNADQYGNPTGKPNADEYQGGRWNPESNIRAAARAFAGKLAAVHANPTAPDTIWDGVAAYYGSNDPAANHAYAMDVKSRYETKYKACAEAAVTSGGGETLPEDWPEEVKAAIAWAKDRLGDRYLFGGYGPFYDCSSFAAGAYTLTSQRLKNIIGGPDQQAHSHGPDTFTLWRMSFPEVTKSALNPGDWVFFDNLEHMGIFIGDGEFIHDPHTGDVVKISGLNESYYQSVWYGAKRVVEWPGSAQR